MFDHVDRHMSQYIFTVYVLYLL